MSDHSVPSPDDPGQVPPAVRAQLLATEHWSLLASRSTTQAEVLTRISIFLTLTSAGLVSLALAGQAMHFDATFQLLALIVLALVLVMGVLTQIRVFTVGFEDLGYVIAMNRLRAAYVALDPGVLPYLMTSPFDDREGAQQTYGMITRQKGSGHFAGSSMMLIATFNAVLVGLFVAGVAASLTVPSLIALVAGLVGGVIYLAVVLRLMFRRFERVWNDYRPSFTSPPAD